MFYRIRCQVQCGAGICNYIVSQVGKLLQRANNIVTEAFALIVHRDYYNRGQFIGQLIGLDSVNCVVSPYRKQKGCETL